MTSSASSTFPSPTGTAIVTGGTSGLGLESARVLAAEPGLRVVITSRDGDRARSAAAALGPRVVGLELDLGSLASVRRFPAALDAAIEAEALPPLKALVANAGLQFTHRAWTEDGFEATFGINHLGHLELIEGLLGRFQTHRASLPRRQPRAARKNRGRRTEGTKAVTACMITTGHGARVGREGPDGHQPRPGQRHRPVKSRAPRS